MEGGCVRVSDATSTFYNSTMNTLESTRIVRIAGDAESECFDQLAIEEPLAIVIGFGPLRERRRETISITMRTPGDDADLAAGLLFTEGVVSEASQILDIRSDESGNQIAVFGRVGARPLSLDEQRQMYYRNGQVWRVSDDPRNSIYHRLLPQR